MTIRESKLFFFYFFLPANVLPTNRSNLNQLLLLSCNLSHHNLYKSLEPSLKFQLFFVFFFLKPTIYSLLSKAFKRTHPYPSLILSNTITQRLITQKWLSNSTLNDYIADLQRFEEGISETWTSNCPFSLQKENSRLEGVADWSN
jgi:hypothetical protein